MIFLVTGAWNDAAAHLDEIKAHGHRVLFLQNEKDELPCDSGMIEAVICNGLFLYHDISTFTSLKYIQLTSAGYDRVPMDYIHAHHIHIVNARGVYSAPMAEHAVMGVLELYRKACVFRNNQKNHIWQKERDLFEINGKKVVIIGCGSVGTECAKRFQAFGACVFGVDISAYGPRYFDKVYEIGEMDQLFRDADIIIITVPLTKETENMISKDRIALMKKTTVLVNISRGRVIDQQALTQALKKHEIYGAVLDVFEEEPLDKNSELWDMDNVILTPHISFIGDGNGKRLSDCILTNLNDYIQE